MVHSLAELDATLSRKRTSHGHKLSESYAQSESALESHASDDRKDAQEYWEFRYLWSSAGNIAMQGWHYFSSCRRLEVQISRDSWLEHRDAGGILSTSNPELVRLELPVVAARCPVLRVLLACRYVV
eukprot:4134100-Amphidinium_carterae.1